jgi:hypothetical protein
MVSALYNKKSSHHATALDYLINNENKYLDSFSFTIVRNPYLRLHSAYYYLKDNGMNLIDEVWYDKYIKKHPTFESFVLNGLEKAITEGAQHFIPQYKYVTDESGKIIVKHIGKLENIEETLDILRSKVGSLALPRINVTNNNKIDLQSIYSRKMLSIVNSLYKHDFEYFDYPYL